MLKLRKGLGLLLVLTMLATIVVMPAASAKTETTTLVDTGFDAPAFSLDGFTVDNGVSIAESGDAERGTVLAIGAVDNSGAHGIKKEINVNSGNVNISAKFNLGKSQWLMFYAEASDGTRVELGRYYWHASTNLFKFAQCKSGTIKDGTDTTERDWQEYTATQQWRRVDIAINLGSKTIASTTDSKDATEHTTNGALGISDIKNIIIANNATCDTSMPNYIDDLKITADSTTYIDENFSRFSALGGFNNVDKGVSVVDSGETERGNVLALGAVANSGAHGAEKTINAESGVINLSMYAKPNQSQWLQVTAQSSTGGLVDLIRIYNNSAGYSAAIYTGGDGTDWDNQGRSWQAPMYANAPRAWYKVDMTIDISQKTTSITISNDAADYSKTITGTLGLKDIAKIKVRNNSNCDTAYPNLVDDLKITHTVEVEEPLPEGYLFLEDFDTMTAETMGTLAAKAAVVDFKTVVEGDTKRNNSIGITKSATGQAELTKAFSTVTEDCVKFTYSVYVPEGGNTVAFMKGTDDRSYVLAHFYNGGVYHSATDANSANKVASYTPGKWITVENIVSLEKQSNKVTVWDADGKLLGSATDEEFCHVDANPYAVRDVALFNFRSWADAGIYTYLDDVLIERYIEKPELSASSVVMTDYKGDEVNSAAPTAGVTQIALDFGTAMNAEAMTGAVTLKSGENTVDFTGTTSGTKYIMTLNGLTTKAPYTLRVEGAVKNEKEQEMGTAFEHTFTAGDGDTAAALINVKEGEADAALANIAKGDILTINAGFDNTAADENMTVTYIVAYYNGTVLKNIKVIEESEALTGAGALTESFTADDMTDINKVVVYMWDSAYSAYPHCIPIEID